MSADKPMLDHLMATPRKELVDDVIFYHDGWIAAGRECNELKAENAKLRDLVVQMYPRAKAFLQMGVQLGCNDTLSYDWELQMQELGIEVPE